MLGTRKRYLDIQVQVQIQVQIRHGQKWLSVCLVLLLGFDPTFRRAPGLLHQTGSYWSQSQEPGFLYQIRRGTAAAPAGNDGYPRCGGRTRLVTTPELARVPFSRVQSANLACRAGCTCWYCLPLHVLWISRPWPPVVIHLLINPASTLFVSLANLLRVSQAAPPSSTSPCRELCLLFSSSSHLLGISPFSVVGEPSLFICASSPTFCLAARSGSFTQQEKLHPSIHPSRLAPSPWPRLASPALTSQRPPSCRYYWTSNWAGQPLTTPGLVSLFCLLFAIHSPAAFHVSLRASSASIPDNPLLFLTHTKSKTLAAPPSSIRALTVQAFSSPAARRSADPRRSCLFGEPAYIATACLLSFHKSSSTPPCRCFSLTTGCHRSIIKPFSDISLVKNTCIKRATISDHLLPTLYTIAHHLLGTVCSHSGYLTFAAAHRISTSTVYTDPAGCSACLSKVAVHARRRRFCSLSHSRSRRYPSSRAFCASSWPAQQAQEAQSPRLRLFPPTNDLLPNPSPAPA